MEPRKVIILDIKVNVIIVAQMHGKPSFSRRTRKLKVRHESESNLVDQELHHIWDFESESNH